MKFDYKDSILDEFEEYLQTTLDHYQTTVINYRLSARQYIDYLQNREDRESWIDNIKDIHIAEEFLQTFNGFDNQIIKRKGIEELLDFLSKKGRFHYFFFRVKDYLKQPEYIIFRAIFIGLSFILTIIAIIQSIIGKVQWIILLICLLIASLVLIALLILFLFIYIEKSSRDRFLSVLAWLVGICLLFLFFWILNVSNLKDSLHGFCCAPTPMITNTVSITATAESDQTPGELTETHTYTSETLTTDTPTPSATPILDLPVLINTPIPNINSIFSFEKAENIIEIARYEWDESEYQETEGHSSYNFGSYVAFSDTNPNLLAAGSRNSTIRLYRLDDGTFIEKKFFYNENDKLEGRFIGISLDENDNYLFASTSWFLYSWQISSESIYKTAEKGSYPNVTKSFDIISPFIPIGHDTGDISILDINNNLFVAYTKLDAHTSNNGMGNIWEIESNESGDYFLSVGSDNTIRQWVIDKNLEVIDQIDSWSPYGGGGITSLDICETKDGDIFSIGSSNSFVRVYSIFKKEPTHSWPPNQTGKGVSSLAFSRDCSILAVGTIDGKIRLLKLSDNSISHVINVFGISGIDDTKVSQKIETMSFSVDGKLLAIGHSRGISIFGVFDN